MTNGPIEFLSDSPLHEVPESEFGGRDGLIQTGPASGPLTDREGMPLEHYNSAQEIRGVMTRAANVPVDVNDRNQKAVEAMVDIIDPHTGLAIVPEDVNQDVTGKWGAEVGLSDGMIQ